MLNIKALPLSTNELCLMLKFFFQKKVKSHGQGNMFKIYSTIVNALS